ncbi:MAG TPA: DNA repair protein RadC [Chiayiivirga sp.]|uniref:DNA repair protein RadC n=1 Tax=Denitratimonas tolerans TaxID=1338420 RepID=A0AAW9R6P3_9GAMM|nr:DNA repair protein RadC [Chiayiivirga sp.]HRO87403.1 DNA repair protein RadC [Chiayiivirga sp.]HRQ35762.1 DNA repair protein RadC [Chiayiivirga sp.]
MNLRDWPAEERPREKLLARGPEALSDAELLAVFFGTGLPGRNAIDLGRELLARRGGLRGLLALPGRELVRESGLGPARAARLVAALELATRHLATGLDRPGAITHPRHAGEYFRARLRDRTREVFACLFVDTRHRPIAMEELFMGTLDSSEVHPREVVRRAMEHNAAAVVFAHNHPSGIAEPSASDRALTVTLREALKLVGVRVLDHFVIGDEVTSFAERGWL